MESKRLTTELFQTISAKQKTQTNIWFIDRHAPHQEQVGTLRCCTGGMPLCEGLLCPQAHAQYSNVLTHNIQTDSFLLCPFKYYVPMKQTLPHYVI